MFARLGVSARDVTILALYFYEGYSLSQIGALEGISKESVHDRIERCVRLLVAAGLPKPRRMLPPRRNGDSHKKYLSGDMLEDVANRKYYGGQYGGK